MTEESVDSREKSPQPRKRNIILYFVRHGAAGYSSRQDMAGYLTETGREQAREAAKTLYQELPEGAVVEFLSSDLNRAEETTEEMKKETERLNDDPQNSKKVFIHHGKVIKDEGEEREKIKTYARLAISDDHTREFFSLSKDESGKEQDAVKVWLDNPNQNVIEMEDNFRSFLRHFNRFSRHVSPGPDIYIVSTVHGGASDVAIGRFLGENALGRLINCEAFKISLLTDGQTTLTFRDETKTISL
ncbi:MAG: histidine phosphatase family protein [Patescibacteria group bacterium]|nr:histidine phosphatase family protein [Patescibacteria group bacterium]